MQQEVLFLTEHRSAWLCCYPLVANAPEDGADLADRAQLYKALGDEHRLMLLQLLQDGPLTLSAATRAIGDSKSTTHYHLAILRQAGLVLIREADQRSYALHAERISQIEQLLTPR